MNNKIKQEIENIEIPKSLHDRSKLGIKKAKAEQPRKKYKNPLIAMAAVSIIGLGMLLTPIGQATFNGLFEVKKFEKRPHNEELSIGYSWEGIGGDSQVIHSSFEEMDAAYTIKLPFPEALVTNEDDAESIEYQSTVDEDRNFIAYDVRVQTSTRSYDVTATSIKEPKPEFRAETTDGTATEKEIFINGIPAMLLGSEDLDGYFLYIKHGEWQMIISGFDRGVHEDGQFDVTGAELIEIAESIRW